MMMIATNIYWMLTTSLGSYHITPSILSKSSDLCTITVPTFQRSKWRHRGLGSVSKATEGEGVVRQGL